MNIESAQINTDAPQGPTPLIEKITLLQEKLEKITYFSENIYGELYGYSPTECQDGGNSKPHLSLEEMVDQMHSITEKLRDCLHDTLMRLRG